MARTQRPLFACLFPAQGRSLAIVLVLIAAGCSKPPEQKSAEWVAAAKVSIEKKDYPRAIIELQNALQATPKRPEPYYEMGRALRLSGEPVQAARYFKAAVDLRPAHAEARLALAELLNMSDDDKIAPVAEAHALAALEQRPNDPDVLYALAAAEWRQKKIESAAAHLQKALQAKPDHLNSASLLAVLQWSQDKNSKEAERTLRGAVDRSPGSAEAILVLGRFYRLTGRNAEAEAQFRTALSVEPQNGAAIVELAGVLQQSGRQPEAEQSLRGLLALPDGSFRTFHAEYLFQNGRQDEAIAELKGLLDKHPEDRKLRATLVGFYAQTGKLSEAEQVLNSAIRKNSSDAEAHEQLGELYLRQGKFAEAEKASAAALKARQGSATAHYLRGKALLGLGREIDAAQEFELSLKLDPGLLAARVEVARRHRLARSVREALEVINGAPSSQSEDLALLVEKNWVLFAQGRFNEARPSVEKALSISRQPSTLMQAGLLALQEGRNEAGRALLEEVLQKEPDNVEALSAIARSFVSEKKIPAALERVRKQAALRPNSARLQLALGSMLEQTGDLGGARAAFAGALRADPENIQAIGANARMDLIQGQYDAARRKIEAILAREPRNVDGLLVQGMLEEATGNIDAAMTAYRAVLRNDPANSIARNNLAMRLCESKSTLDEALLLALELKRANPDNPEVDDTLGWVYYKKGAYEEAIQHFSRAGARAKSARFKYHLAMALFRAGDKTQGQKALAAAMQIDPGAPEAAEARRLAAADP